MEHLTFVQGAVVALGGAIGALAKDVIQDNTLEIPQIVDKKLFLGSLGGAIIGAFIGFVIDGSPLTAVLAGYTGKSVLENLLLNTQLKTKSK